MMEWHQWIQEGRVVRGSPDLQQAKALIETSQRMMDAAKRLANTAADVSNAYSALRQLLEAICIREGFRVYAHEAYTAYLKHRNFLSLSEKFERMRKIRNGIEYYGKNFDASTAESLINEIETIRQEIIKRVQ